MKFFLSLFIGLVAIAASAQPCSSINKLRLTGKISFAHKIPSDISAICIKRGNACDVEYDSLTPSQRKKYKDMFTFSGVLFSSIRIETNEDGQIQTVSLLLNFDSAHHTIDKIPPVYANFYNRLVDKYGKPSYEKGNTNDDANLKKLVGISRYSSWLCDQKSFSLNVTYGAETKGYNIFAIQLNDKSLEKPPAQETLAN